MKRNQSIAGSHHKIIEASKSARSLQSPVSSCKTKVPKAPTPLIKESDPKRRRLTTESWKRPTLEVAVASTNTLIEAENWSLLNKRLSPQEKTTAWATLKMSTPKALTWKEPWLTVSPTTPLTSPRTGKTRETECSRPSTRITLKKFKKKHLIQSILRLKVLTSISSMKRNLLSCWITTRWSLPKKRNTRDRL